MGTISAAQWLAKLLPFEQYLAKNASAPGANAHPWDESTLCIRESLNGSPKASGEIFDYADSAVTWRNFVATFPQSLLRVERTRGIADG